MTVGKIQDMFRAMDVFPVEFFLDSKYATPSLDWIIGPFSTALAQHVHTLGLAYRTEAWDCDDFALFAKTIASICHRLTSKRREGGLAFGMFAYEATNQGPHAINFAICSRKVVFYEPQIQKIITLTQKEIRSCYALFC